jgi:hypothetical protein
VHTAVPALGRLRQEDLPWRTSSSLAWTPCQWDLVSKTKQNKKMLKIKMNLSHLNITNW